MIRNEAPDYGKKYTDDEYQVTFERIGGMDEREVLISNMLSDAGYACGIFGKWDLGTLKRFLPTSRGFDDFYGFVNTGIDYFTHERYGVPSMFRNLEPTEADKGVYATELFRREALRFCRHAPRAPLLPVRSVQRAPLGFEPRSANSQRRAGHRQGTRRCIPLCKRKPGMSNASTAMATSLRSETLPRVVWSTWPRLRKWTPAIGDLLDRLETFELAENTIVIFFSDNGGGGGADNSPLKGHKAQMWEGGIRVPCLVKYSPAISANTVSDAFLTSLEIVPTLLDLTPAEAPANTILDGYNMLPVLADGSPSPRTSMFWKRRGDRAARVGDWKWVSTSKGGGLFHLATDISEKNDVSQAHPDKLAKLRSAFSEWMQEMDSAEPRGPFSDF